LVTRDTLVASTLTMSAPQLTAVVGAASDVVTLALAGDIDAIHKNGGWIPADWQKRLPLNSAPYTSTIVLVVRQGNPKNIKEWSDLARPGISVITPNPKTSGGARYNYLAAWGYALKQPGGNEKTAQELLTKIYKNVPVLDTGARGSSISFAQRAQGDVFISWENEAYLLEKEFGNKVDFVYPSLSILAEPAVTVVDKNVDKKGTRKVAEAYLQFLYTEEAQDLIGKHFYRPRHEKFLAKYAAKLPKMQLFTLEKAFGSWEQVGKEHFADGGIFDQIYTQKTPSR
jgi:sulfate transport system substrate-binding protein